MRKRGTKYGIATCPLCFENGILVIVQRPNGTLFLLCNECKWAFDDPMKIVHADDGYCGADIIETPASLEQISAAGWSQHVVHHLNL
ncbi:MAG: hypothetical protein H6809_03565 [Phycisphaeraceae bacterium]|nr:hypothetical protein [Phycisphaeraceae bacterium]